MEDEETFAALGISPPPPPTGCWPRRSKSSGVFSPSILWTSLMV